MSRNSLAIILSGLWSLILIFALCFGREFAWPDYFHVNYGYPLVWGIHTLSTIYGSVDIWSVNPMALSLDLIFWLAIMILALYLVLNVKAK